MPDDKPLSGGKAFDQLAEKLAKVPKAELDRRLALEQKRRAKRRRKKE